MLKVESLYRKIPWFLQWNALLKWMYTVSTCPCMSNFLNGALLVVGNMCCSISSINTRVNDVFMNFGKIWNNWYSHIIFLGTFCMNSIDSCVFSKCQKSRYLKDKFSKTFPNADLVFLIKKNGANCKLWPAISKCPQT